MSWASDYKLFSRAAAEIQARSVRPSYSYIIAGSDGVPIALSPGDFCLPAKVKAKILEERLVLLEDRRFRNHSGVDIFGLLRASLASVRALSFVQGGSTITQQLIRSRYLHGRKHISRKIFEIILSLIIERKYSKEEILSLYMDSIYMGPGIRGFEAAAMTAFRKPLRLTSLSERSALLGLVNRPIAYSPLISKQRFIERQAVVAGFLGERSEEIQVATMKPPRRESSIQYTSDKLLSSTGLNRGQARRVIVTASSSVQRELDRVIRSISESAGGREAAFIVASLRNGAVIADAAWSNGVAKQDGFNFFRKIQPGSTFKAFALLEAVHQGISLDEIFDSSPYVGRIVGESDVWAVHNHDRVYSGETSLLSGFIRSDNTVFARLSERIDVDRLYKGLKGFRLLGPADSFHRALVLGATRDGVTLAALVGAYAAIANGGAVNGLRLIDKIETHGGERIFPGGGDELVLDYSPAALSAVRLALRRSGVVYAGRPIAGKTGTSSFGTAYVGYDEEFVYGLWMGRAQSPSAVEKGHAAKAGFLHVIGSISSVLFGKGLMSI